MEITKRLLLVPSLALTLLLCVPTEVLAHPSPIDFWGLHRHEIGAALTVIAIMVVSLIYLFVGLRKSSRAETVRDFFFFSKKVSSHQYFDTTVAYSFQVVVTVYFVYWGFEYGIGVFIYPLTWLAGIFLFQLSAPRLLDFAEREETLHSYLSKCYGAAPLIRTITAACTLFGMTGALLIEAYYTTNLVAKVGQERTGEFGWVFIFTAFLVISWLYVRYGGYKATVITDAVQLPITYAALATVFLFLVVLGYRSGFRVDSLITALLVALLWAAIVLARIHGTNKGARRDLATIVSIIAAVGTFGVGLSGFLGASATAEAVGRSGAFSLHAMTNQSVLVFISFLILNLSWQFFDMAAWQRISSLDLSGLQRVDRIARLRSAIGETKWESPITWMFGVLFGIALRHIPDLMPSATAATAFDDFVGVLVDNDIAGSVGMMATYVALPALVIAFFGIMLSTTDSFLATSAFAWTHDILRQPNTNGLLDQRISQSTELKRAQKATGYLLFLSATVFVVFSRILEWDVFLLINVVYSAQFVITFYTLGAILFPEPHRHKSAATIAVLAGLVANLAAALYC